MKDATSIKPSPCASGQFAIQRLLSLGLYDAERSSAPIVRADIFEVLLDYARIANTTERAPTTPAAVKEAARPDDIRAAGWVVAVHNDYRVSGEPHTFWLFTKDGRAVRGEGRTDADALNEVRNALRIDHTPALSAPSAGGLTSGEGATVDEVVQAMVEDAELAVIGTSATSDATVKLVKT